MSRPRIHTDNLTPIEETHLSTIYSELGNTVTTVVSNAWSAKLAARTPYALGMLIGCIMNLWVRRGISFDTLTIIPSKLMASVSIRDHPEENRLIIDWL